MKINDIKNKQKKQKRKVQEAATKGEKIGSTLGGLGGLGTGAAIGSAILPGVGTAIGAGLGALSGSKLGGDIGSGAKNWFARQGLLGRNAGIAATQANNLKQAQRYIQTEFLAKLEHDFNQAVAGGRIGAGSTASATATTGQQSASTGAQSKQTGPIMSNDPDARAKLAALPRKTPVGQNAQDAAARAGLTPNADPRRTAAYNQARARQPNGPIMSNTPAAGPLNTGPTGGTKVTPTNPPPQVSKLNKPLSDQELRDIEAKRQMAKESMFDDFAGLDQLLESMMLNEAMTAGDWLTRYIKNTISKLDYNPVDVDDDIGRIAKEFESEYTKTGRYPKNLGTKIAGLVQSINSMYQPKERDYNRDTASQLARLQTQYENTPPGPERDKILDLMHRLGRTISGSKTNAQAGQSAATAQQTLKDLAAEMKKYVASQNTIDGNANDIKESMNIITQLFKYLGQFPNGLQMQQRVYKAMDRLMRDASRAKTAQPQQPAQQSESRKLRKKAL